MPSPLATRASFAAAYRVARGFDERELRRRDALHKERLAVGHGVAWLALVLACRCRLWRAVRDPLTLHLGERLRRRGLAEPLDVGELFAADNRQRFIERAV